MKFKKKSPEMHTASQNTSIGSEEMLQTHNIRYLESIPQYKKAIHK